MKNFKILLFSLLSFSIFDANAALITNLEIKPVESSNEVQLSIEARGGGIISISVWNKKKCMLENDYEALNSFEKTINFKGMKSGDYTLRIEDELFVKIYDVRLDENGVNVNLDAVDKSFKPYFEFQPGNKRLRVNWLMHDFERPIVIIRDNSNDVIFERRFDKNLTFSKQFDLRSYKSGIYHVTVKNKTHSHDYQLEI